MMDLSHLTPATIRCLCSGCSGSLAVLENEWAKLSVSYSRATGWISINPNWLVLVPGSKVPGSDFLGQRPVQHLQCRLCQQNVAILCLLDDGSVAGREGFGARRATTDVTRPRPTILWNHRKVSLTDAFSLETVQPLYEDGKLEYQALDTHAKVDPSTPDPMQF